MWRSARLTWLLRLLRSAGFGTLELKPVQAFSDVERRSWPAIASPTWRHLVATLLVVSAVVGFSGVARAEAGNARASKLAAMLGNSDFRVRTQAAFSLGRLDDPSSVAALVRVLGDRHPAVRAAAAVALGRIGDPSALPHLQRHNDSSAAVKTQIRRAIGLIEANHTTKTTLDWGGAHHYIELDSVANVSKTKRAGLDKLVHSLSLREMRRLSGIIAVDGQSRPADANAQIKRRKLPGYSVSVSLGRLVRYMGPQKVRVQAEVMLAVMTYPGRIYRMTANGSGAVTIPRGSFRTKQLSALQEDALSGALQQAFRTLGKTLEQQAAKTKRRPRRRRR